MSVINVNELAEAIVIFTLLPSINVIDKADNFVVDKNGAKPILVHEDDNTEKAIKIAYNWDVENKLISIN